MLAQSMGKVKFLSKVGLSQRWLTILCFVTHKLWERVCSDFGELPEAEVKVALHDKPVSTLVGVQGKPLFILIGLPTLAQIAIDEIEDGNPEERVLRTFRAVVCEELVHLHDLLSGSPVMKVTKDEADPIEGMRDPLKHYLEESEYRALRYTVEITGQRKRLLARVEQVRC